jgi:hypothetical protein
VRRATPSDYSIWSYAVTAAGRENVDMVRLATERAPVHARSIPLCVKGFLFRVFGRAGAARDIAGACA